MSHAFLPSWPRGCWPDETQSLLLAACLLEDQDRAQAAFREWSQRVPLFFVDSGSTSLLLLLYDRLRSWNCDYVDMQRLQGMARFHWVKHQQHLKLLRSITQAFAREGLDSLLLKGAALNATVYANSTRMMSDIDIAVRRAEIDRAIAVLQRLGWIPQLSQPKRLLPVVHACQFNHGDQHLDLHWDLLHGKPLDDASQQQFWNASLRIVVGDAEVCVLCPADQLLHTCQHGMRVNDVAPFRWLADACRIVRAGGIDWQRLAGMAERYQMIEPVIASLRYLNERLEVEIPAAALSDLAARRRSLASRCEFYFTTHRMPGSHPFWSRLPNRVFDYARALRAFPGLTFVEYMSAFHHFETPFWDNFRLLAKLQARSIYYDTAKMIELWCNGLRSPFTRISLCDNQFWQGFFEPETCRQGICRWSQEVASVLLPACEPSTVVMHLAEVRPWHGDLCESLSFRVNRTPVPASNVRFDNWNVSFDIEPDMLLDYHQQRLELRCPRWNIPSDPRTLGVPVCEIKLLPKCA